MTLEKKMPEDLPYQRQVAQCAINLTSVLNRKNGFAQRAKLAQKLRWRKATKSNFCDKVFIGFENHVMATLFLIQNYIP